MKRNFPQDLPLSSMYHEGEPLVETRQSKREREIKQIVSSENMKRMVDNYKNALKAFMDRPEQKTLSDFTLARRIYAQTLHALGLNAEDLPTVREVMQAHV